MKLIAILIAAVVFAILAPQTASARKAALDHIQFDGVSSDGELKTEHHTRREWLEIYPVQAKIYWDAWDCKGQPCDSNWKANIRRKAARIKRTGKDAPVRVQQPTEK